VTSELQLEMEKLTKITMAVDTASRLALDEIMTVMIEEIDEKPTRSQVHANIMQTFSECDFKKTSGHKDHSPIGNYRLHWINVDEKMAAASVLLCVGTAFGLGLLPLHIFEQYWVRSDLLQPYQD